MTRQCGADLTGRLSRPGLVDELRQFLVSVVVEDDKPALPGGAGLDPALLDTQRFAATVCSVNPAKPA